MDTIPLQGRIFASAAGKHITGKPSAVSSFKDYICCDNYLT